VSEIEGIISRHTIAALAIKGAEGLASRGRSFVERIENEAAAIIAATNSGLRKVPRKTKSSIAKDLGLKGRPKYLADLDTTPLDGYGGLTEKIREAVLVAWSEL